MKRVRKLIPAIAMLMVSVIMLSTTSFAWFSMNTKVSVSSMTVKATASKNLLISGSNTDGSDKGDYKPSLALTTSVSTLVPASTAGAGAPTFYKLKDVGHGMNADNYAKAFDTTFETATANTDYVKETMYIKSTGMDASNLKANITYTGGTQALDPALRVMILVGENRYYYTPVSGASSWAGITSITDAETKVQASGTAIAGVTYYSDADCANAADVTVGADVSSLYVKLPAGIPTLKSANETVSNSSTPILTTMTADSAVKVEVYIWYEGQDTNCKSTNAVILDNTVFSIEFTVEG